MYERGAEAYDLLVSARGKDYRGEAATVRDLIRERRPTARTLLDVACGTGGHLEFLRYDFEVAGVDASDGMLALAAPKLGAVALHRGDMLTVQLGQRFDAVTCLFSSIGYLVSEAQLRRGIANLAAHLVVGGVLIVEPWIHPDQWIEGNLDAGSAKSSDLAVARVVTSARSDRVATLEMQWLLASKLGVELVREQHVTGLYTIEEYKDAFRAAGLDVEHDELGLIGRGLFIGVARTEA